MTELTTGAERARAREEARRLELNERYAGVTGQGDTRASKRRLEKQEVKHKQALQRIMKHYSTPTYEVE